MLPHASEMTLDDSSRLYRRGYCTRALWREFPITYKILYVWNAGISFGPIHSMGTQANKYESAI